MTIVDAQIAGVTEQATKPHCLVVVIDIRRAVTELEPTRSDLATTLLGNEFIIEIVLLHVPNLASPEVSVEVLAKPLTVDM